MTQDYSLIGTTGRDAEEAGLANPKWYRTKLDPNVVRTLMEKSDRIALRDTLLWLGILGSSGAVAVVLWPSWWSAPFWLIYGLMYGSASDARWHECGHQTAFKTPWMNTLVYSLASFFLFRNPVVWRASHVRHHTDTIIVGRDPEIQAMRPPDLIRLIINIFGVIEVWTNLKRMVLHARGKIHPEEAPYLRAQEHAAVFRAARIGLSIHVTTLVVAITTASILPLMLIGLPRLYGGWHMTMTGVLQHLGLAENVTDHRLNTRTVLMNPVSRFIYLNMNYHLEHHMFTMVPYYNLPKLHELIKHDTPAPDRSIISALRRLVPVMKMQLRYKDAVIVPALPDTARPYRDEVKALLPHAIADAATPI